MAEPLVKLSALTPAQMSQLLSRAGLGTVTDAMLDADRKAGAPVNPDGNFNLVHYLAWLVRESDDGG
jgi:hypothetical protein